MGRADSLAKLAWAYGVHQTLRLYQGTPTQLKELLDTYAPDEMWMSISVGGLQGANAIRCVGVEQLLELIAGPLIEPERLVQTVGPGQRGERVRATH